MTKFKENSSLTDVFSISSPTKQENEVLVLYLMDNNKLYEEHHALVCSEDPAYICSVEYKGKPASMTKGRHTWQYGSKFDRNMTLLSQIKNGKVLKFDRLFYAIMLRKMDDNGVSSDQIIGHFEIYDEGSQKVQFAVYINKSFSSKGYGTLAAKLGLGLVEKHMQVKQVVYECNDDNIGSCHIPENTGFTKGQFRYYDTCFYTKDL
jgi:RimJ/RimL family protein N-acetyltransferase